MKNLIISLLVSICLVDCGYHTTELYGIGKTTTILVAGDGASSNSILGDTFTNKNSTATKILANAFVQLVGAYWAGNAIKVQETTKQMANAGATQAKIETAKIAASTEAKKIDSAENLAGMRTGLFKIGETIFKQK